MSTSRAQLLIVFTVCAATFAGYWWGYSTVTGLRATAANLMTQIAERKALTDEKITGRSMLAEIQESEVLIQSYFVPEEKAAAFIDDLQARGRSQGIVVTVSSVSKTGADSKAVLTLSLSLSGKFDAVMRTVGMIESAPYNLALTSFNLNQDDKSLWHADVRVTVGSLAPTP